MSILNAAVGTVDVNGAARMLLGWVGDAVLFGTAAAALTWAMLSIIGRRIRPAIHGMFWIVALSKFVIPIGPAWDWSLASAAQAIRSSWPGSEASAVAPAGSAAADRGTEWAWLPANVDAPAASGGTARVFPAWAVIGSAYLLGIIVIGALRLRGYRAVVRKCRDLPTGEPWATAIVRDVCVRLHLRRAPEIRVSREAPAPFVFGIWRPQLILSTRHLVRPDELEAVVLHEIAHLRRGDQFVRCCQWIAGTCFYFWPVVAWVNRRIDLAREHACDEWALYRGHLSAGQYARCLLRALHPVNPAWSAYRPAAMAANRSHVERRIEMIMQTNGRSNRTARGTWVAGMLVLAWAAFTLCGAAKGRAEAPLQGNDAQAAPADDNQKTFEVQIDGPAEGEEPQDVLFLRDDSADATKTGAERKPLKIRMRLMTEKDLAEFGKQHPTADANGDGKITKVEHDAFLTAMAMANPAGVLQQFPKADRDNDGQLSAEEAAQLVGGGMWMRRMETKKGEGTAGEQHVVHKFVIRHDEEHSFNGMATPGDATICDPATATSWLLEHSAADPTAAEVQQYVELVDQLPLKAMLKRHPEADTDGDGKISPAERDAMLEKEAAEARQMLLKHFPEADTNHDGVLSEEELRNAPMHKVVVKKSDGTGGETTETVESGDGKMEANVIVIRKDKPSGDQ